MIETILSIALFTSIAGVSAIALYSIDQNTNIDRTTTAVGNALRQAELSSIAMEYDMPWGVYISSEEVTLFQGETYEERAPSEDVDIPIPSAITVSGLEEIRFAKTSGNPHVTGNIILSTAYESRTITINEDGTILY